MKFKKLLLLTLLIIPLFFTSQVFAGGLDNLVYTYEKIDDAAWTSEEDDLGTSSFMYLEANMALPTYNIKEIAFEFAGLGDTYNYIYDHPDVSGTSLNSHIGVRVSSTWHYYDLYSVIYINGYDRDDFINTIVSGDYFQFIIDTSDGTLFDYDLEDITMINIRLNTNAPSEFVTDDLSYFNTFTSVNILTQKYTVTYKDRLTVFAVESLYLEEDYLTLPVTSPTPPEGATFKGWKTTTNIIVTDTTTIEETWFTDNVIFLYAVYIAADGSEYELPTPDINAPSGLTTILTAIGLGSSFGKYIVYFALIIIVTLGISFITTTIFAYLVVYMAISILWVFLGYMPMYIAIVIFIFLTLLMSFVLKGGHNE